jgi:dethiobiotin synthetase
MSVFAISGIDTDIGKSVAVGLMARYLLRQGKRVITQKMIQTGVSGTVSEDILLHRRLMGTGLLPADESGGTCPYLFTMPASPHLAAEQEHRVIDVSQITAATRRLLTQYDIVLLEGVGGLLVPLNYSYADMDSGTLLADYLAEQRYPLVVVTSGKLGSLNHTLLTLEAARHCGIPFAGLVYNHYPVPRNETENRIARDTLVFFRSTLRQYAGTDYDGNSAVVEIPFLDQNRIPDIDFSPLFNPLT